jgi:hypothetical protein
LQLANIRLDAYWINEGPDPFRALAHPVSQFLGMCLLVGNEETAVSSDSFNRVAATKIAQG